MNVQLVVIVAVLYTVLVYAEEVPSPKFDKSKKYSKLVKSKQITTKTDGDLILTDTAKDGLTRHKKSTTTTFCVEIRPNGSEDKSYQVCDSSPYSTAQNQYIGSESSSSSSSSSAIYKPAAPSYTAHKPTATASVSSFTAEFAAPVPAYAPPKPAPYHAQQSDGISSFSSSSSSSNAIPPPTGYQSAKPVSTSFSSGSTHATAPAYGRYSYPSIPHSQSSSHGQVAHGHSSHYRSEDDFEADESEHPQIDLVGSELAEMKHIELEADEERDNQDQPAMRSAYGDYGGYGGGYGADLAGHGFGHGGYGGTLMTYKPLKKGKKGGKKGEGHNGLVITCKPSLAGYATAGHGMGGYGHYRSAYAPQVRPKYRPGGNIPPNYNDAPVQYGSPPLPYTGELESAVQTEGGSSYGMQASSISQAGGEYKEPIPSYSSAPIPSYQGPAQVSGESSFGSQYVPQESGYEANAAYGPSSAQILSPKPDYSGHSSSASVISRPVIVPQYRPTPENPPRPSYSSNIVIHKPIPSYNNGLAAQASAAQASQSVSTYSAPSIQSYQPTGGIAHINQYSAAPSVHPGLSYGAPSQSKPFYSQSLSHNSHGIKPAVYAPLPTYNTVHSSTSHQKPGKYVPSLGGHSAGSGYKAPLTYGGAAMSKFNAPAYSSGGSSVYTPPGTYRSADDQSFKKMESKLLDETALKGDKPLELTKVRAAEEKSQLEHDENGNKGKLTADKKIDIVSSPNRENLDDSHKDSLSLPSDNKNDQALDKEGAIVAAALPSGNWKSQIVASPPGWSNQMVGNKNTEQIIMKNEGREEISNR